MISIDLSSYKDLFLKTSREYISELRSNLNLLNMDPSNKELIYEVFRLTHTLKSQNYFMGFIKMADLSHVIEKYFHNIKDGKINYSAENLTLIMDEITKLENSINNVEKNNVEVDLTQDTENLKQKLNIVLI